MTLRVVTRVSELCSGVAPGLVVPVCLVLARFFPESNYVKVASHMTRTVGASAAFDWVAGLFDGGYVPGTGSATIITDCDNLGAATASATASATATTTGAATSTSVGTGTSGQPVRLHQRYQKVVLHRAILALEHAGMRPFLCFGTLLGLVREGGFITNDSDIDIGLFYNETTCEAVKSAFEAAGFTIKVFEADPWPCTIKVNLPDLNPKITVDVVFFKPEAGNLLTYIRIPGRTLIRRREMFDLERTDFDGIPVWVPDPPEGFLRENYGNWKQKSSFHHPVLTSPLTDFGDSMVRTYLATLLLKLTIDGNHNLIHLVDLAKKKYPADEAWLPILSWYKSSGNAF